MFLVRKLICFLGIHKLYFIQYLFTDRVVNLPVNLYGCEWCSKRWNAHTHRSRFKIYKGGIK